MPTTIRRDPKQVGDDPPKRTPPPIVTLEREGNSSKKKFPLTAGLVPFAVYEDGRRKRPGINERYIITHNGFVYSVEFNVAAPSNVCIEIDCYREVT